ncbi:hypothetical protein [Actinokineospora sp. NBRC 105648]|uniref:hypothetical protein n=1 Tax=Actinokineospora sp. NBRC 105648 TaxID=3032206 RepID=UPI0024A4DF7D|nr:hypothetical protein [Actinokineospora sp. NBRC 105648]GLZ42452.1 hypothetical protein Acsp05_60760 [Actinokineospora sp. NBRC 105648]
MSESQECPTPVAPPGGDAYMLSRLPQTTAHVLKTADPTEPWPKGVPSLVEDIGYLIKYANQVQLSLTEDSFDEGMEVDNLDSTAYRVIEACRWLQVHQARRYRMIESRSTPQGRS